jgi:hypothetical protein
LSGMVGPAIWVNVVEAEAGAGMIRASAASGSA